MPRGNGRHRNDSASRNPYQGKPRRILTPEELRTGVGELQRDINHHANLIPCRKEVLDLLGVIFMVFEEERFYKVVPKSVQADWEVRLRRKIRHDLEKLAAKFGYTLIDRRES